MLNSPGQAAPQEQDLSGIPAGTPLSFNSAEVKELAFTSCNFLAALVLGATFTCEFSPMHLSYWEMLTKDILSFGKETRERDHAQFAFGLPRGFAKTTLLKLYLLWCIIFTKQTFFLVVSASGARAEDFIADVCGFLDSYNIRTIFGNWRVGLSKDTQDLKKFNFAGRPVVLMALGAEASVRGVNINNERPQVIICEDTQSKESANSLVQNDSFVKWFIGTLMKTKAPAASQTVFIGNLYNEVCLLYRLKNSAEWISFIAPGILAGRKSLWPEFRTYESLLQEFRNDLSLGAPEVFLAEVMNDPHAEATSQLDVSKIPEYPYAINEVPSGRFLTIDPALGLLGGNATAIIEHEVIDGKDVIRRVHSGQWGDEETVRRGLEISLSTNTPLIAVESVAYQATLLNYFNREIAAKSLTGLIVIPVLTKGIAKNTKIANFLRKLFLAEVLIHPEARPAVFFQAARWKAIKKDNEDDVLDASAMGEYVLQDNWHLILTASVSFDAEYAQAKVLSTHENCAF